MVASGEQGLHSTFTPSNRILDLARHKTSKTVWATTPCEKLNWGNQESIWPLSASALRAVPSARIQHLSRHKRGLSAREDRGRKQEEEEEEAATASFFGKSRRTSSWESQHQCIVRLSTPKTRSRQEVRPPHTPQCDTNCPIRHVAPRANAAVMSLRLLQLSRPKLTHPDFQGNRECVESIDSMSSKTSRVSQRLVQLSLPRLRESNICRQLGRPEEPIWTVPRAARRAAASARVETLATPKQLCKDYIPPREPEWSRDTSALQSSHHSYIGSVFRAVQS